MLTYADVCSRMLTYAATRTNNKSQEPVTATLVESNHHRTPKVVPGEDHQR
jgi:hypothetical protein